MIFQEVEIESQRSSVFSEDYLTQGHRQKDTNLCFAVSAVSLIRAESANAIVNEKGVQHKEVRDLLQTDEYAHRRMLCSYLFCVYPRSMDGLAKNKHGEDLTDYVKQFGNFRKAVERLAKPTALHQEGWKMILPLTSLFKKFGMDIDEYDLETQEVYHPKSNWYDPKQDISFDDVLAEKRLILRNCFIIIGI